MFRTTRVCAGLMVAFGGLLSAVAPAHAQQALDRVEITGSAVRRIEGEAALPVQIIKREDIERTGATSVADLLQQLPAMQNFTNEGASVGGGGNGFSGASIHNLGETRTLVLLNGRRLATFAGQYITGSLAGIDLNTIPLAAIDRVEILTDGASALYGADAVGGVVNFITKRNYTDGDVTVGYSAPSKGGREKRVSLAKGVGNLDTDGFNVMFSANFEKRDVLRSTDREFSKTGVIDFDLNGRRVSFFNGSPRGIPGNVTHDNGTPDDGDPTNGSETGDDYLVSPYFAANGRCPDKHVALMEDPSGTTPACYYDYVQDLQILPERERASFLAQANIKLGENHTAFMEFLSSNTKNVNRIAPPPGEIRVDASAPEVQLVNPGRTGTVVVPYRVADVGQRTQKDKTEAQHFVAGVEGSLAGWDYNTSLTHSINKQKTYLEGGYVELNRFLDALANAGVNPFVLPGNQSPAAQQALNDARILGFWEGGKSTLDVVQLRASRELMPLSGGPLAMAAGVSFMREEFEKSAADLAQGIGGSRFGDDAGIVPYSASRNAKGIFGELVAPVMKGLEFTGSLRHDEYSDFGGATTAKLSARFQPTSSVLLRGSVGTGFKAPTVPQVKATRQLFGVTSGNYTCPVGSALAQLAADLGAQCPTGNVQYNVYAEGNPDLKPEKSNQWTIGFRVEPASWISVGADLWEVHLKNAIGQVDEATIFGDPLAWRSSFTTYTDPGTGDTLLAMYAPNVNLGENIQRGIDLDTRARFDLGFGRMTTVLNLTYWLKDKYQLEQGGEFQSSLGKFGPDGNVTFRWQGKLSTTLEHDSFAHTLGINFKSGYKDQSYTAADFAVFDPNTFESFDYNGSVKRYVSFDWQTNWKINKMFAVTVGVLNFTDEDPPRSLKSAGGGQQIGYDDRYYDPRGRTFYVNASMKF